MAFLDIDQELLAPRERAREQALALLARAARLVRGRDRHGRLLVQTRRPEDVVLQAVLHADPDRVRVAEEEVRRALGLSPFRAVALVSGPSAPAFVEALGRPLGVDVEAGAGGAWRLRADSHDGAVRCPGGGRAAVGAAADRGRSPAQLTGAAPVVGRGGRRCRSAGDAGRRGRRSGRRRSGRRVSG